MQQAGWYPSPEILEALQRKVEEEETEGREDFKEDLDCEAKSKSSCTADPRRGQSRLEKPCAEGFPMLSPFLSGL